MKIILADSMGMCFGVRDALAVADSVPDPLHVTIYGQLVHNPQVVARFAQRGFTTTDERSRPAIPSTPAVLITAHGISDTQRARLAESGKRLIDATCPLVRRAHRAALLLAAEGRHVLVIGQRGHVEVLGLIGDLKSFEVIQSPDDVRPYPFTRLGIICQTTATVRDVDRIRRAIVRQNPAADIRFIDTVCRPTRQRQAALDRLLDQVDAMVVIGGPNSNNTQKLLDRCGQRGVPAHQVQCAGDIVPAWFAACAVVGVTAGTSTLDSTIHDVCTALEGLSASIQRKEPHEPESIPAIGASNRPAA